MFYSCKDNSIKYTGRWCEDDSCFCSTAPGSFFKIAFEGEDITLYFDTLWNREPYPHLYLSLDGGARFESPLSSFLRVEAPQSGNHVLTVIFKSAVEMQHRWHSPLIAKVSFLGYEAQKNAEIFDAKEKIIEFVGDSITEGVLINEEKQADKTNGFNNRVYQDDSTATYAWLTAKNLGLTPIIMGYGAVGATKGGCGSVPRAAEAYPYCFESHKTNYDSPDYILINHGANDRGASAEEYLKSYGELLDVIRKINPRSRLIALSAFCGAFHKELGEFICKYNKENFCDILFIDSSGWIPEEPLHPDRNGHKIIAERLTEILKSKL